MKKHMNPVIASLGLVLSLAPLFPNIAEGGSNSGSSASSMTGMSCDNRKTIDSSFASWCTTPTAEIIKNKCVVVIHAQQIQNCGWQGCGFVSFVNERPRLAGGSVNEYGIATPAGFTGAPPASWEANAALVMPKSPFPRHYLTVSQFIAERAKCAALTPQARSSEIASGTILGKICSVSPDTLNFNPYYYCMVNRQVIPTMP
ncbi:MAG: hypothetical protein RLZZ488_1323 [Pseudomonadota bacterium]|jgi:hypothetical protein